MHDKILLVDGEQYTFVHACVYAVEVRKTERQKERERERESGAYLPSLYTPSDAGETVIRS